MHAARLRLRAQPLPLHVKAPLHEVPKVQLGSGLAAQRRERLRVAPSVGRGPAVPGLAVALVQQHEQGVVIEPMRLRLHEVGQRLPLGLTRARHEALPGRAQGRRTPGQHARKVAMLGRKGRRVLQRCCVEPAAAHQVIQVHEPGAAGKGRGALVRRRARARRRERQHLPQRLPCGLQPAEEVARFGPQVARAMRARQASQVQQHTAGAARQEGVHGRCHEADSLSGGCGGGDRARGA
jgi:hypothetical protein